ncbi:helix-turn-helix domain-containing transcriptional regulator [Bartonella raoultii]|uniref:Addiction module antidote protein n=1 Tax=Bartonella raoultii TaxID=1457020 RepID=A0ABS7I669_9HYPH|nr:addiction module antidote protein [Bartonella raoultii]MBX4336393.1 addiction module antidote protein [Bartonella raoultii]
MKDRNHDDAMAEIFRDDLELAAATLDAILADGDQGELLITLRQMAKAYGGVQAVAKAANLNPTQLYRTLSEKGNPEFRSLNAVLRTMGFRLAVQPLERSVPHV